MIWGKTYFDQFIKKRSFAGFADGGEEITVLATEAEWLKMLTCRHLISQHCNHVGSDPIRETDSRVFGNHTGSDSMENMGQVMQKYVLCHPRSMISTFVVCCLGSMVCLLALSKVSRF